MQYTELIDYELSLPIQYAGPLKGLCIYNELNFINRLTEKQKQKLVNHHSMVIRLGNIKFIFCCSAVMWIQVILYLITKSPFNYAC